MNKIRILVVDDSFFMRRLISDLLKQEKDFEIVGEARDGYEAVAMAAKLEPDVITMDYQMPGMNGKEATEKILEDSTRFPAIIMFSSMTRQGAEETLDCLLAGAVDFIAKPSDDIAADIGNLKDEIISKIRIASSAVVGRQVSFRLPELDKTSDRREHPRIVVIGSSTGGPPVVEKILSSLPPHLNAILIVVQHMPEKFTKSFAERLDRVVPYQTKEAAERDVLKSGICLIAPGGYHLKVEERKYERGVVSVHLSKEDPIFGLRPAINITMKSLAKLFGSDVVGIILTGMGEDGAEGMREIKDRGGKTIVQSPETSVIDSMPKAIIKRGLADEILPPEKIALRIAELCR